MTIDDVKRALEGIKALALDDESAHAAEDGLHQEVLAAIADGTAENPQEMARLALTSLDTNYGRWCA